MLNVVNVEIGVYFVCDFGINIFCNGLLFVKYNVVILDYNKVNLGLYVVIEEGVVIVIVIYLLEE